MDISLGVVVVALLITLAAKILSAIRIPALVPPTPDDPDASFSVVAVGARGSGKTLLLASLYQELQTPTGRSYFLTAPHDQVITMNEWYAKTADTRQDWPPGTTSGETRDFALMVQTRMASGAVLPVLRVNYLDYSGGVIADSQAPGSTAQSDVLGRIASAHALIGIVDGYRVRQAMDGVEEGFIELRRGLNLMISLTLLATCPVTFVVTKWDLLAGLGGDEDTSLRMVKKYLLNLHGFRDLVEQHSRSRVARLIPVSAVGPNFAVLDERGRVAKIFGGEVNPTNVEVPLCAVVPDLFEQLEQEIDEKKLQKEFARIHKKMRLGPGAAAAQLGLFLTKAASSTLLSMTPRAVGLLGDAALEMLFRGEYQNKEISATADHELSLAEHNFKEFRQARRRVLSDFKRSVVDLEHRLPSSRLTAGE